MTTILPEPGRGVTPRQKIVFAGFDPYEIPWGAKRRTRREHMVLPTRPVAADAGPWKYPPVAPYDHFVAKPRRRQGWPSASTETRHVLSFDPRWRDIVQQVCEKHSVSFLDVISDRRKTAMVAARQECFYRLYSETLMSTPSIGRALGGKDHTTVLHGIRKHKLREGLR